jgi:hypothetical protein
MRATSALVFFSVLLMTAQASAGDNSLLDRFKQQNDKGREKLKAEIKDALERAQALEKDDPLQAIGILQDTRDRLLQKGMLTERDDRALAEPLWERIQALRGIVRGVKAEELRATLGDYKEYITRMNEQFAQLRKALVPVAAKEAPPGGPAFIAFANGKQAVAWLNEPPDFVVHCTINDQPIILAPGLVAGLQTADGFYLFDPATRRFLRLSRAELFVTAVASYPPARRNGFWLPWQETAPPAGYDKRSVGAAGLTLFARSAGVLMTTWTTPTARRPDLSAGRTSSPETARLYRDVMIELRVQEAFAKLKREDQNRFREVILTFLDRRPRDEPLTTDEIARFADLLAEIYPERRSDAVAFAHLLNRFFEENRPQKK